MKKILGVLLMLSMAIGGTVIATNTTKDVQAATTIQSNRWYEGMTDGYDEQVYTYKVQGPGYFYYQVVPDQAGHYYDGEFYDTTSHYVQTSMIKNYKSYENNQNANYSDGGFQSSNYSFKAGDIVTIKVKDYMSYYRTHYKIKVTFVKVKNFERENNNSRSKANKIKKGVTYTGLTTSNDPDWFVFKAPKTKKYKVKAVVTSETSWSIDTNVYRGYKSKGYVSLRQGEGWKTAYSGKLKKGQKIYIKLDNGGLYDNYSSRMYKIKVK